MVTLKLSVIVNRRRSVLLQDGCQRGQWRGIPAPIARPGAAACSASWLRLCRA